MSNLIFHHLVHLVSLLGALYPIGFLLFLQILDVNIRNHLKRNANKLNRIKTICFIPFNNSMWSIIHFKLFLCVCRVARGVKVEKFSLLQFSHLISNCMFKYHMLIILYYIFEHSY